MDILRRQFNIIAREDDNSVMGGYAFRFGEVFNSPFGKEQFSPALKMELNKDVYLLRDHDPGKILAKAGQNMAVGLDKTGLYFSVSELPKTELSRETAELVKRGILSGASVGFRALSESIENKINTFKKIMLYEVSIVGRPAYQSSKVTARSKENKTLKNKQLPPECFI